MFCVPKSARPRVVSEENEESCGPGIIRARCDTVRVRQAAHFNLRRIHSEADSSREGEEQVASSKLRASAWVSTGRSETDGEVAEIDPR